MTQRIFTEEDRKAFAGLLPFAPGASAPFTPAAFESVDAGRRPVLRIRKFGKEAKLLLTQHAKSETINKDVMVEILLKKESDGSSAMMPWERMPTLPDGVELEFTPENVAELPDSMILEAWNRAWSFTYGPTKEEKEGLPV